MDCSCNPNPGPGPDPDPDPTPPDPVPGKYQCPVDCYTNPVIYDQDKGIYSFTKMSSRPYFEFSLETWLGVSKWLDWDGRIAKSNKSFRGSRGNGFRDLDVNYLSSPASISDGRYKCLEGIWRPATGSHCPYVYIPDIDCWVRSRDLSSSDPMIQIIGFWSSGENPPSSFDGYNSTLCPIKVIVAVPTDN